MKDDETIMTKDQRMRWIEVMDWQDQLRMSIDDLCSTERYDVVYGYELGKLRENLVKSILDMRDIMEEICENA